MDRLIYDPLVQAFRDITLTSDVFQSILNAANLDALETAASEIVLRDMPLILELYESNGQPLTFDRFVKDLLGKHGHWFQVEESADLTPGWITLRHEYGSKWSKFLRAYLASCHAAFSRGDLEFKIGDRFVRFRLSSNQIGQMNSWNGSHGKIRSAPEERTTSALIMG